MAHFTKRFGFLGFLAAGCVAALASTSLAAPLDDRVPADAIIYAGWAGADSLQGQYAQSNLKGILDASTIRDVIRKQLPPLLDRAAGRNPGGAKARDMLEQGLTIAWHHPLAMYVRSLDFSNPQQPVPRVGFICDAGNDAKNLADLLNGAVAEAQPPAAAQMQVVTQGNLVFFSVGSGDTPDDLKKNGGLAGAAAYKAAMTNVKIDAPAMAGYIDVPQGIAAVKEAMDKAPNTPPDAKAKATQVIEALGLNSLTQVAFASGFDKAGWADRSFMGINGPRKGIAAMMGDTPLSDEALAAVPQNASAFSAWKLDLHKMYTQVRGIAGQMDPDAQKQLDDGIARANTMLKLDIEKDLLAAMGDEWVVYRAPISDAGSTMALVQHLKDGPAFSKSLDTIEKLANAQLRDSPVKIEKVSTAKTQVSTIALLQYNIAWTVKNDTLYVSTLDGIGGAIKQVENKSPSILTSDAYKAARSALPAGVKPTAISYADPARLYPTLRVLGMGVLPLARSNGVQIPNDIFPDPDDVSKFMTPGATINWSDAAGIHTAANSAFPGAEMLGGGQIGPSSPMLVGVAAGILLPSLGKARELSNRSVDAANLRGIAQSCVVWAADNNDSMPDNLARLVADGMVSPKQLVSRRAGTEPLDYTPEMQKVAKDDYAKFADQLAQHTDYVYLGGGTKNQTDGTIVVVYEKPGPYSADGINIGFQDAHAEFVRWDSVEGAFKETNAMLKLAGKPQVDVHAMIKAAGAAVPVDARDLP